jgi:nucleoside-diphosphate-sugar epimerase
MRVLILGGTGLISTGIVKHLLARGTDVTVFTRGQRQVKLPDGVHEMVGDRDALAASEKTFAREQFDVVIDMICFTPEQANAAVRAFSGCCSHFIFCSTVCVYGVKTPPHIIIDESFPREPISTYGKNKLACEQVFGRADKAGQLKVTIIRPSHTYGPGSPLIDQLEIDPRAWDRIDRGLAILCAGEGQTLWQATHRDDVGKLFAYAALKPKTYGQEYNATREQIFTWRDYYRQVGQAMKKRVPLIFMPADWIVQHDPERFSLLKEITRFHSAYSSAKARHDVPEFKCEIDFPAGAAQTLADVKRRSYCQMLWMALIKRRRP